MAEPPAPQPTSTVEGPAEVRQSAEERPLPPVEVQVERQPGAHPLLHDVVPSVLERMAHDGDKELHEDKEEQDVDEEVEEPASHQVLVVEGVLRPGVHEHVEA